MKLMVINCSKGNALIEFLMSILILGTIFLYIFIMIIEICDRNQIDVALFKALREASLKANLNHLSNIEKNEIDRIFQKHITINDLKYSFNILINNPSHIKIKINYTKNDFIKLSFEREMDLYR
jgi:hypothetical protein